MSKLSEESLKESLYEKLLGKKCFIYKDKKSKKLYIIGENFYFEETYGYVVEELYKDYEKIDLNNKKDGDVDVFKKLMRKINPISLSKKEKINKRKELKEYIEELNKYEIDDYKNQIEKFEKLYKKYI